MSRNCLSNVIDRVTHFQNTLKCTCVLQANLAHHRMALQTNVEENADVLPPSKASLVQRPQTAHPLQRNTLGDIGNKVSAITITDGIKKGPVKKEIVQISTKQQKALTKSKATSSLRTLAETNVLPQV